MRSLARFGGLVLAMVVAAGCSNFSRDARLARARMGVASGPEGCWSGTWHDAARPQHGGGVEMVLTRQGEHLYRLASRSTWWKWFRSSIDTVVVVHPVAPGEYLVLGSRDIRGFGDYRIEGRIDVAGFHGRYEAAGHRGVLELRRTVR